MIDREERRSLGTSWTVVLAQEDLPQYLLLNVMYQLPSVLPTGVEFSVTVNPNLTDDADKLICISTYYVLVWLQALCVLTFKILTMTVLDRSKFLKVWSLEKQHQDHLEAS